MCMLSLAVEYQTFRLTPVFLPVVFILVSACTPSSEPAVEPWRLGEDQKSTVYPYKKLRARVEGWQIWEAATKKRSACVAVKPAQGTPQPSLSLTEGAITGNGGFYMYLIGNASVPTFSFYGRYGFAREIVVETDGATITDTTDLAKILGWDGRAVAFQVTTQPYGQIYEDRLKPPGVFELDQIFRPTAPASPQTSGDAHDVAKGVLDFSGLRKAYDVMMQCHSFISSS